MAEYYVRNDTVQNGLGQAIPNVAVTYYTQPSLALATVYEAATGTITTNPQYTNGLGQTTAYLAAGQYTISYSGPQIQTLAYADQNVGASAGAFENPFAGTPLGTINGTNTVFTLTNGGALLPAAAVPGTVLVWLNVPLISGIGFTISGNTITFASAPQVGDSIYAQGSYA